MIYGFVFFGIPLLAIIEVCRTLRGGSRIFWLVFIIGGFLILPILGLFFSAIFFIFKKRFVAAQRRYRKP